MNKNIDSQIRLDFKIFHRQSVCHLVLTLHYGMHKGIKRMINMPTMLMGHPNIREEVIRLYGL